jgi:16S rRNA (adenine1518-N6/adenine1519-N6)-dimethyltransferase
MRLRRCWGQHFLRDQAVIDRIVTVLAPKPTDHLLEIGPGDGALTVPVLQLVACLEAIERDRHLIPLLQKRTQAMGTLVIHAADVLLFDFSNLRRDERLLRIFGNLPYNISTPLIFHLLRFAPMVEDMLFMLQKEVAYRLVAQASTSSYGRLSVMAQYHCRAEWLFDVPRQAFYPPPQVESSMVRLVPYRDRPYVAQDYSLFAAIVKQAFNQRRKTLHNSLRQLVRDDTWKKITVDARLRAENLSVQDFVLITNALNYR